MPSPIKFTSQDIQPIMESVIQFVNSMDAYQDAIQHINKTITRPDSQYFEVLVNDGIKRKDKKHHLKTHFKIDIGSNKSLAKSILVSPKSLTPTPSPKCHHIEADYFGTRVFVFPTSKNRSKNCCAVYDTHLIFKSNITTNEQLEDFLMNNPVILGDLIQKASWAISYYKANPKCYQNDMDKFLVNMEKINLIDKTKTIRNIPFMQTMEHLRQFLFDTLIAHHAFQIASTTEDAKKHLKANKADIFTLAEQFGYISNAQKMIKYQKLRDDLAHPDNTHHVGGTRLPDDCTEIKEDFEAVLTTLLHGQNIKIMAIDSDQTATIQKALAQMPDDENIFSNAHAYQLIDQLDTVQNLFKIYTLPTRSNGKSLTGKKKLEALNTLGVLSQNDITTLEQAITTRNNFAHGSVSSLPAPDILKNNKSVHTVLRNITQYQRDRDQYLR